MIAKKIASTLDMSIEEWRELRRSGIGGSDAGALLGLSPWASPLSVYCDKKRLTPEKDDTEAMRQGRDLEQYVAERFAEVAGKSVKRCNYILQHPEYPWMLANVDRMVVGEDAGLECKTTSALTRTDYDDGDIPSHYYAQCMHYMAVTGLKRWYLAVLVLGKSFHVFEVERDEDEINELIAAEQTFWIEHVEKGVMPAPDGSENDGKIVERLHAGKDATAVLFGYDGDIAEMLELKKQKKELEKRIDTLEQSIKVALNGADHGESDRYRVSWPEYKRVSIDSKALKAERPDIYDDYKSVSTYRRFTVKEIA